MKTKTRLRALTLEEHRQIGAELSREHRELARLYGKLANTYGKTSASARAAGRLTNALLRLRSALDDALARDCPDDFSGRVYFGLPPDQMEET